MSANIHFKSGDTMSINISQILEEANATVNPDNVTYYYTLKYDNGILHDGELEVFEGKYEEKPLVSE
jgi:hypothetical protein